MMNEFTPPRQSAEKSGGLSHGFSQLNQKEAALGVASTEDGKGKVSERATVSIQKHSMTPKENQAGVIEALLPVGAENAISTRRLVEIAGCRSPRQLQSMIAEERERGTVILSRTGGGYYLPSEGEKGRQEMCDFVSTINSRAINTLHAAASAKAALAVLDGQQILEELEDEQA